MSIKVKKFLVCILFIVIGMATCYVFAENNTTLCSFIMTIDGFIWGTVMYKYFSHEWERMDINPYKRYVNTKGKMVTIYRYKCRKCGKIKHVKFQFL